MEQLPRTPPGNASKLKTKTWPHECKTFTRGMNI